MAKSAIQFSDFLSAVEPKYHAFVESLNDALTEAGCAISIKESKSGFLVSYTLNKKTIMNWVFRKAGILARIYGDNAGKYEDVLAALPEDMRRKMTESRDCKRLLDPNACSPTCVKGFVYTLDGIACKKCRNDGMLFLLTDETAPHISAIIRAEVAARKFNA